MFYVIYADLLIVALTSVGHAVIHITLKVICYIIEYNPTNLHPNDDTELVKVEIFCT